MKFSLLSLLGVVLFAYILLNIDLGRTLEILSGSNLSIIAVALAVVSVGIYFKAMKWKVLLRSYGIDYPTLTCLKYMFIGLSLGMTTPGRIGELSRIYDLRKRISAGKAITSVIVDRIIDIFILFALAIIGILNLSSYSGYGNIAMTIAVFFLIFLAAVYAFTKKGLVKSILKPVFSRIVPDKHKSKINLNFHEFYDGMRDLKRWNLATAIMLGAAAWMAIVFQYYLLSVAIGLQVPFMFLLWVAPVIMLLDALPVSVSGLGTRDAALIFFLSALSISSEYAISFSLLVFLIGYFIPILIGLVAFILTKK